MTFDDLSSQVGGVVLTRKDDGFADELAGADTAVVHTPDVVVGVASIDDVIAAVRYAVVNSLPLSIVATGHGIAEAVTSGMVITTKRLKQISIDPDSRLGTIGAGTTWSDVLPVAAEHGLTAIAGSSPFVGTIGYTLGGGAGPLIRSHGFTSDWVRAFTIVLASGEAVTASADENPHLYWALRGGKGGFGVVTDMTIELLPLPTIYAGDLYFDEPDIETALRGWAEWTSTAPDDVSTSVALTHYPPSDEVPAPFRGKHIMALRFAYPGNAGDGSRIADGLRSVAPVYLDQLGELSTVDVGRIHNDPEGPGESWNGGRLLTSIDQEFVGELLEHVGAGKQTDFVSVEVRQFGGRAAIDVPEGSAVGGRSGAYNLFTVAADPSTFAQKVPAQFDALLSDLSPWASDQSNINFTVDIRTDEQFRRNWEPETFERLRAVREEYDPGHVFAYGPSDR